MKHTSKANQKTASAFFRVRPLVALIACVLVGPPVFAENLQQIYQLAANKDPEIRKARADYKARHTDIDAQRSSLLPTLNATASDIRSTSGLAEADSVDVRREHSFGDGIIAKGYGISMQQKLINFQAWYTFKSAKKGDEQATLTLAKSEQDLIVKVAKAYFDVLKSGVNLASLTAEEAAFNQLMERDKLKLDAGLATVTDIYDSKASADLASYNRLVEENNLNRLREILTAITGQEFSELATLAADFPIESVDPNSIDAWVKLAKENNIAIKIAQLDLDAKQLDAKATKAAAYPTVGLSLGYTWANSGVPFPPATVVHPTVGSTVGLSFTLPLYSGGLRSAQTSKAYFNRDASEEALLKSNRDNTMGARTAYRSVESDIKAVAASAQAVISAQSALDSNQQGAEVGTRNILDVVQAQNKLFQNQRNYANARFNYVLDTLALKQAAGVLSPEDVLEINQWLRP